MKLPIYILQLFMMLSIVADSAPNSVQAEPVKSFLSSTEKSNPYIVGQKITLVIEVLSETHFSGSTRFALPDIPGAVFYKPEERAVVSSKIIDGTSYSIQRHEFAFYPQRPGSFEIPAFDVRYGIASQIGKKPTAHTRPTTSIKITAAMPPGGEKLHSLISTTNLKVTEIWSPEIKDSFIAGNAIKRHITFRASDMPGMVFPSIHTPEVDGLKIYRARAVINDKLNRGSLTGERSDTITYVCQQPGHYELPAIAIHWWDLYQKKLKVITLPTVTFEVTPSPYQKTTREDSSVSALDPSTWIGWKAITATLFFLLCAGGALYRFRRPIKQRLAHWQHQRKESESAYFKKITPDLSPAEMLNAITRWLAHTAQPHITLTDWAQTRNNPELIQHVEKLQRAVISKDPTFDASALISSLKNERAAASTSNLSKQNPLHPLNPIQ